ncbi:MAG: 16S rRNA (guanine(527)-N(7))-methyltransferase RsmG [Clostridiales bacterium]|nr:16S rRNA (guanine(527)-N(7))-methyltransferase RsmG [Clostridiales bacterium]
MENFVERAQEFGVSVSEEQQELFSRFYGLIIVKNRMMNLTKITEPEEVAEKHFLDSIALAGVIDLSGRHSLLDMGTGAGFPGVPLKITFPKLKITLADSLHKRIIFLQETIAELGFSGVELVHGRAEDLARMDGYREKFDIVVSRAVASLPTLVELCMPFVKVHGKFIAYKGGDCDEEIDSAKNAIALLGGEIAEIRNFTLGEAGRTFVVVDKVKKTDAHYPRRAGLPGKRPL